MTTRTSAGILLYRRDDAGFQVLLAHPGGPQNRRRDLGHWTIPKGEPDDDAEPLLDVARREFEEETGMAVPAGPAIELGSITQKGGKVVHAWAVEGDLDPATSVSNTFEMEWPPHSGMIASYPEIDRVEWFGLDEARERIKDRQAEFLVRLVAADPGRSPAGR